MLPLSLRPHFALLLLLCFGRTLLPEAWVLALHAHQHTTEEPAFKKPAQSQPLLSAQHQHCQVEQFYDVPFQAAVPVELTLPYPTPRYQPLAVATTLASAAAVRRSLLLRGPPAG